MSGGLTNQGTGCGLVALVLLGAFGFIMFFLSGGFAGGFPQFPFGGQFPGGGGNNPPAAVTYNGGSGGADQMPDISPRDFTSGSAPVTTSGAFALSDTFGEVGGFADGVETTIVFGDYPAEGVLVAFSRNEGSEGLGFNVASGDLIAQYLGEGCTWEVTVTESAVSGHIECTDLLVINQATGAEAGTIDVEFDFTANSVPVEGDGESATPD